jgi:outer membrane receptor for ferrienterochelin and colicins
LFFRYYQGVLDKAVDQLNNTTGQLMNTGSWVRAERTMRALEGRLTRTLNPRHTFTLGAEYRPEKFRGTAVNTGEGLFNVTAHGVTKQGSTAWLDYLGLYALDEWTISPRWKATLALRYDDNNKFGNDLSPKLGLVYNISASSRLKLNAAHAFRSPTPNQLYNSTAGQLGNPNLRSETANSYDLSWEREQGRAAYKFTYFYNAVRDLITITGGRHQNIDKATLQGAEAEYRLQLNSNWALKGSYAWLSAVDDTENARLPGRARHLLTVRADYDSLGKLSASLWAQFFGNYLPKDDPSILNQSARSYTTLNLSGRYQFDKRASLTVGLYNLLGHKDQDTLLPGRYLHAGLNLSF